MASLSYPCHFSSKQFALSHWTSEESRIQNLSVPHRGRMEASLGVKNMLLTAPGELDPYGTRKRRELISHGTPRPLHTHT